MSELLHQDNCRLWDCTSYLWPGNQEAELKREVLLLLTPQQLHFDIQKASMWALEFWVKRLNFVLLSQQKNSQRCRKLASISLLTFQYHMSVTP